MINNYNKNKISKILFVDDEQNILNSIIRNTQKAPFLVFTALSAKKAYRILEQENMDIVVSDYRMPDIDGIQFLKSVKKKYPRINRIILSGVLDQTTVLKSLNYGLASVYFTKPWDNEKLIRKLEHIIHIRNILNEQKLLKFLNSIENIPVLPAVYYDILNAIEQEKSIDEIGKIVIKDTVISTKIIQVVNSAFFGFNNVTNINEAIMRLGLNLVKDLLIQVSIIDEGKINNEEKDELSNIFTHAYLVHKYLPLFYKLKFKPGNIKKIPTIGIIYQIGRIIILNYFPDYYFEVLKNTTRNGLISFHESEIELNTKNAYNNYIGAYFLDLWNFPNIFIESALFYVSPEKASPENKNLIEILNYTDRIINIFLRTNNTEDIDFSKSVIGYENRFYEIINDIKEDIITFKN